MSRISRCAELAYMAVYNRPRLYYNATESTYLFQVGGKVLRFNKVLPPSQKIDIFDNICDISS